MKHPFRLTAAFLTVLLLLALTGCGSGSNSFTWFVDTIPANLDPQVASTASDIIACENLYSGLVRKNPDGEIEPALCERWERSADGRTYTFYLKNGLTYTAAKGAGTIVYVARDGQFLGSILISDEEKPTAKAAMQGLQAQGVRTVMLTGDTPAVAELVAKDLGIDEVHAGLLPADKVEWVEKLLGQKPAKKELAFVGDGINDAPVLMRADIGIAMGALGSDAAIEAADVVLMDDDPAKISLAMRISRKCMTIAYQNIVFALAIKALCLILTALGITNMWWGVFADVGVMVLAVLNATRMLNVKQYQ